VQDAFFSVVRDRTLDNFPNLRFGFIEAAAGWVPHMLWSAGFDPRLVSTGESPGVNFVPPQQRDRIEEFLSDRRIFVTCEEAESVPDLIDRIGDRSLMLGSDYSHPDRASIHHVLQRVYDSKDISRESAERLTRDNANRLYGLA
jgi:predicted TIM-barrel fold metal-dependent hydrolase